jgi:cellulose biosynthesis protein BcsQ
VLIACWSAKGGSGTTVVSVALASLLARSSAGGVLLADLGGDCATVLGLPDHTGPGLRDWLDAGADVATDALSRLELDVRPGLRLLPWAGGAAPSGGGERLAAALADTSRLVVVDCGPAGSPAGLAVAAMAGLSLLVLRPCSLALRRALAAPVRPSGVVLVREPQRALGRRDVEDVLGVPVRAEIPYDPAVAQAVDAGLLNCRVPRVLERGLRAAA